MYNGTKDIVEQFDHKVFGRVRIVVDGGEPWFFGVDVARALGYARPRDAVQRHCNRAKSLISLGAVKHGGCDFNELGSPPRVIAESDVYRLIFRSKLPGAEEFVDWVVEDVLPTIRKTGQYIADREDLYRFPKILAVWETAKKLGELRGYDKNQATLAADKMCKRYYGYDMVSRVGIPSLPSRKQEAVLIPTEIGNLLGMTAREVNAALADAGLQVLVRRPASVKGKLRSTWNLTETGKEHGSYYDVGKAHSDGTPIQQIKWYESVIELLRDEDDDDDE